MKQTTISIETARAMYERGGTAKEFALENFTETELQKKPSYPKQTAVEWLGLELNMIFHDITPELWEEVELKFQQAKQMEKEQIEDAHEIGYINGGNHKNVNGEQYYNETYGETKN
jgi:hypothetical protein